MLANFSGISSSLRSHARDVAPWWILKYGNMIRRLIDTDFRQVYELQHHTNSAQRGKLQSAPALPGSKEMGGGTVSQAAPHAKPPAGRGYGGSAPNHSKQNLDTEFML